MKPSADSGKVAPMDDTEKRIDILTEFEEWSRDWTPEQLQHYAETGEPPNIPTGTA